jgi:hypothetical protein
MRVIYDAPGQTCNRLWSYVASVAMCLAEHRKMAIIFHDETLEDFPSFLHCNFIYFPLWHKWLLERRNGWKYYNGIIWRIKFKYKKEWDSIAQFFGFTNGWQTRFDNRYLRQTLPELKRIFLPKDEIMQKAKKMIIELKKDADIVVGVHIRRGDYASWHDGRFYYELESYHQIMLRIQQLYNNKRVCFFLSSNEDFSINAFEGCQCKRFGHEPSGAILDLYTLSLCNYIIGPYSTFSRWASFIGEVPLCFIETKDQQFTKDSFSKIVDFFHFESGKAIFDW